MSIVSSTFLFGLPTGLQAVDTDGTANALLAAAAAATGCSEPNLLAIDVLCACAFSAVMI